MQIDDVLKANQKNEDVIDAAAKKILLHGPVTLIDLANRLGCAPKHAEAAVERLKAKNHNVRLSHSEISVSAPPSGGDHLLAPKLHANREYRFGVVSDNHLASKYARLDVLNSLYDIFEREGVSDVYNAGNMIDGECRFNTHDLLVRSGIEAQLEYLAEHYPQRKGITTHYIAGDDHEGWYVQREGVDIGRMMQARFEDAGRTDMHYLGYLEADVKLKAPKGETWIRVMHPGGGSAYATSYTTQKIVESFQGGEKPHVLIVGHYHKMDFCIPREVFAIQAGCTQDQTPFMRKNKLQAHVGGWVCRMIQATDGHVISLSGDWRRYYDRSFYEGQKYPRW